MFCSDPPHDHDDGVQSNIGELSCGRDPQSVSNFDWSDALGGLEHSDDFTADRHRRAAERWPKAQVSIYPAWMRQPFPEQPLGAKPRTLP